jgi:hypothetical protein
LDSAYSLGTFALQAKNRNHTAMNPSEPDQPDKTPEELPTEAAGQPTDERAYFPEFAPLEDGEAEFDTVDYRHCDSGSYLDLETTYLTKRIWEQSRLTLTNWRRLSELEALTLAQFAGDLTIWFENDLEPELQLHLCRILAEHRGMLFLVGEVKLTGDAATALLQHPGPIVVAVKLDFHTAYILGTRFDIQIISDWWQL